MHGLLAAFGPIAARWASKDAAAALAQYRGVTRTIQSARSDALIVLSTPTHGNNETTVVEFDDLGLRMVLDGYLLIDGITSGKQQDHLRRFAELARAKGPSSAANSLSAGAFHVAVIDDRKHNHWLLSDPFGSIPLYHVDKQEGLIASTNPRALAAAPIGSSEVDSIGIAERVMFGYTIGERYLRSDIRTAGPGTLVEWRADRQRATIDRAGFVAEHTVPSGNAPPVKQVGEQLRAACQRIEALAGQTAHLQSGGMDSRAILASWPADSPLTCYTYGKPDSAEVAVARLVAEAKGAPLSYWRSSASQVADALEPMFQGSGLFDYPDRFLVAEAMVADGSCTVLDGYLGDVLLGGTYFSNDRYFPSWSAIPRLLTRLVDTSISKVGLDAIADALYEEICDMPNPEILGGIVSEDFIEFLYAQREHLVADIHQELDRLSSNSDSVSLLFRNFLIANRGRHAIAQQAVMCRQHIGVRFPFTNDIPLLRTLLAIPPRYTAYRRYYIELFRECFPVFASIPYDSTMLPLSRSALHHKWSALLSSRGLNVPYLTGPRISRVKPINWSGWIRQSPEIREIIAESLRAGGIDNEKRMSDELEHIASGVRPVSGKLLHVAAVARWMNSSDSSS